MWVGLYPLRIRNIKMLSKQAIEEFKAIYLKTYGEELSFAEAAEQAQQMLSLFKIVLNSPSKESAEDTEKEQSLLRNNILL